MNADNKTTQGRILALNSVISYPPALFRVLGLSKTARNVLDILLSIMAVDNMILFDSDTYYKIQAIYKRGAKKAIQKQSVRNAINELRKVEILVRWGSQNDIINPSFYIRNVPFAVETRDSLIDRLKRESLIS